MSTQQKEQPRNNKPVSGQVGVVAQEDLKRGQSPQTDRTGESQANDDPSSAPESGDKEP